MTPEGISETLARARDLAGAGRLADAEALLLDMVRLQHAPDAALDLHAVILQRQGRHEERAAVRRRLRDRKPGSMVAEHNLASALGDMGRFADAERSAMAAFSKGGDAPETWLVLARALQAQGRLEEASKAFGEAIRRRPTYLDALRDDAQLTWMQTGDPAAACARIDAALIHTPAGALRALKSRILEYAGDPRAAYAAATDGPMDGPACNAAARAAVHFDPPMAVGHAREAVRLAPGDQAAACGLVEALLASGAAAEADRLLEPLLAASPLDQQLIALRAAAWRLLGDARVANLYDYDRMVLASVIDTPEGWPGLAAYLADLAPALRALHRLKTHPLDQSLRHGTQTTADLTLSEEPVIRAFFKAIDGPIRRYIAALGDGDDPLRRRNTGDYRIGGAWSVQLRPNGFHADHFHGEGWLSSACYIEVPAAVHGDGKEGWLKFGQPGAPTQPRLEPEHHVKPEPGLLALFPSYMWHGTVPFSGDQTRLTIAFDVVPA
ncbi:putative 2OG-Fe(II) oxygenase [Brevundimonas sp.]|uniref:putative 2OG-Fe(II) oxygenase n=1 Tax=Brevundimonas sp. TaxID=1871086 RepID=UPI00391946B2